MKDCTIVKKLKSNKEKALELLMERYASYVVAIVSRVGGNMLCVEDVEEITSDVFYTIWKNRSTLIESDSLKPYIGQIARNMAKSKMVRFKDYEPLEEEIINKNAPSIEDFILQKEQIMFLSDFIDKLAYPDKDILRAYYLEEYKLDEIATRYQIPLSTVKSKVYRGKKEILKEYIAGGY